MSAVGAETMPTRGKTTSLLTVKNRYNLNGCYGGPVVHNTMETSHNTLILVQLNRNKAQHNDISTTQ